jgi:predicted tellurium resistance membrane protein TerC
MQRRRRARPVKDLPPQQRGRALRYGILGAYAFRILALAVAAWIMSKWYLKVLGGL